MDLDLIIQSRRSIRKYKNSKPDWRTIIECIDAMRYAPMSGGIFTLKFILVSDKEKINKLAKAAQQQFISTAKYVVVVLSKPNRTINAYGKRGENYIKQQAGAAIQNFLLKAHEKGLATCWVGHFVENMIKTVLKIPEELTVEAIFPIGKANEKPKPKSLAELDSFLYFEEYENQQMRKIKKIEQA